VRLARYRAVPDTIAVRAEMALVALARARALLAGSGRSASPKRSLLHIFAFAAIMAVMVFVILDLEYPRLGLIRVDAFDQILVDRLAGMNEGLCLENEPRPRFRRAAVRLRDRSIS
jgi:hypothetical protein